MERPKPSIPWHLLRPVVALEVAMVQLMEEVMSTAANTVLEVVARQPEPPRCIFITSDYETADQRLRSETSVPVTIVRPYALNDKPPKGTYNATTKSPMHIAKPIARADVAAFLLEATTNPDWDGPTGVQLSGN